MNYREISLNGWVRKGEGATAAVYINEADDDVILKLFFPEVEYEAARDEYDKSVSVSNMGLPTPKALEFVTYEGRNGIIYEKIKNKKSISRAIADDFSRAEEYMRVFAEMCYKLHHTVCTEPEIPSLKERLFKAIGEFDLLSESQRPILREFLKNNFTDEKLCIHCDMHIGNVVLSGSTPYWIDLGTFCYGDPMFDLSIFYLFTTQVSDVPFIQDVFHLNGEQLRTCWKHFRKYYFKGLSEEEIEEKEKSLQKFLVFYFIYSVVILGVRAPTLERDFAAAMKAFE